MASAREIAKQHRNARRIYRFMMCNWAFQEIRPRFAKEVDAIDAVIERLRIDPLFDGKVSRSLVRSLLAMTRARVGEGQWHFSGTQDTATGDLRITVAEGPKTRYPHPCNWRTASAV